MSDTLSTISAEQLSNAVSHVVSAVGCGNPAMGSLHPEVKAAPLTAGSIASSFSAIHSAQESSMQSLGGLSFPPTGSMPFVLSLDLGARSMLRLSETPLTDRPLLPDVRAFSRGGPPPLPATVGVPGAGLIPSIDSSRIAPYPGPLPLPLSQLLPGEKPLSLQQPIPTLHHLPPSNAGSLPPISSAVVLSTASAARMETLTPVVPLYTQRAPPPLSTETLLAYHQQAPLLTAPPQLSAQTQSAETSSITVSAAAAAAASTSASLAVLSPGTMRLLHSPIDSSSENIASGSARVPDTTPVSGGSREKTSLSTQQRAGIESGQEQELNRSLHYPSFSANIPGNQANVSPTAPDAPVHVTIAHEPPSDEESNTGQDGDSLCPPRSVDTLTEIEIIDEDEDSGDDDDDDSDDEPGFNEVVPTTNDRVIGVATDDVETPQQEYHHDHSDNNSSSSTQNHSQSFLVNTSQVRQTLETNQSQEMFHASIAETNTNQSDSLIHADQEAAVAVQHDHLLHHATNVNMTDVSQSDSLLHLVHSKRMEDPALDSVHNRGDTGHFSDPSAVSIGATGCSQLEQALGMVESNQAANAESEVPGPDDDLTQERREGREQSAPQLPDGEHIMDDSILSLPPVSCALQNLAESCIMDKVNQHSMAAVIDLILKSHMAPPPPNPDRLGPQVPPDSCVLPRPVIDGPPITLGVYCVDCNKMYEGQCPVHSYHFSHLGDTPILTRARMTLPVQLKFKYLNLQHTPNNMGVVAVLPVPCRTKFGPLEGKLTTREELERPNETAYVWEVFEDGKSNKLLDCRSEQDANWLMFVKRARTTVEQNVMVYQQGSEIFFVTCKEIVPDTELLYWYARDYARLLGVAQRPEDLFRCPQCGKQYPDIKSVNQHIKYIHPDMSLRKHKCDLCEKKFTSLSKLNTHILCHMGLKPHKCEYCSKTFTDNSNLRMHLRLHTGEKRFRCGMCSKAFTQKAHLDTHVLVHTGEKRLKCRFCTKMFVRPSDLRQHEYVHTQERIYCCSHTDCGKVFFKLQNFRKHIKVHNGIKDHFCLKCGKAFSSKYHMQRHLSKCKGLEVSGSRSQISAETVADLGLSIAKRRIQRDEAMKAAAEASEASGAMTVLDAVDESIEQNMSPAEASVDGMETESSSGDEEEEGDEDDE